MIDQQGDLSQGHSKTVYLKLGLELSQNPDWDLNPRSQHLNPAETHGLPTEITHLVSGLNEARALYVSLQKEFRERQSGG